MTSNRLILLCDHLGAGIEREVKLLAARGFRVETTRSLRRSLERIEEGGPALLVLDPIHPRGEVELREVDLARAGDPPIPLLIVADPEGPLDALVGARALTAGAWDVVRRDATSEEIQLRLERLENERSLLFRASHDDHTDLLRPKAFQARLTEHFSAVERHHFGLALVLIDLDRFGQINKEHDHIVGDNVIGRVGEVIRKALRREDVAGRLGGDEFAVLLPYTEKIDAARVVNRLREEIRGLSGRPPGARGEILISASLGFETCDGNDIDSADTLRRHAERAMRAAKLQGGDRGVYYRSLEDQRAAE
ncbi:MAG: GGDEF domain-containing protein [Planctomycetota bacterium]|nr:GGDEF domain-containing protein [Planctomycetota bacterium]